MLCSLNGRVVPFSLEENGVKTLDPLYTHSGDLLWLTEADSSRTEALPEQASQQDGSLRQDLT